jgi:hypothetical protein
MADFKRPDGLAGMTPYAALKLASRFKFQLMHLNASSCRLASWHSYRTHR